MPTDANGVYTLPAGYLAVNSTTIETSQHNPPLEDLETAMTGRLPRNGTAPMTGPLKLDDGTAAAPALRHASNTGSGFYAGLGGKMTPKDVIGGPYIGEIRRMAGSTVPTGWLHCYGQALSRTAYADLFAEIGTTYGAPDGSTFNLPDCRGRVSAGKDNMGGTSANRLTGADDGLNGDTLGATGGIEAQQLVTANLPPYTPAGTNSLDNLSLAIDVLSVNNRATGGEHANLVVGGVYNTQAPVLKSGSIPFTGTAQGGTSTAFGVVQPTIIFNEIIFTGVA